MRKPRLLRPGDRVALVAPASAFARAEFDAGIAELRTLGFDPVYEESVFERRTYAAGSAATRAAAFERAWRDPSIAAVIAVRGGYGSVPAPRGHPRPRGFRPRPPPAGARPCALRRPAESVHRLQRQHVDHDVAHARR